MTWGGGVSESDVKMTWGGGSKMGFFWWRHFWMVPLLKAKMVDNQSGDNTKSPSLFSTSNASKFLYFSWRSFLLSVSSRITIEWAIEPTRHEPVRAVADRLLPCNNYLLFFWQFSRSPREKPVRHGADRSVKFLINFELFFLQSSVTWGNNIYTTC